MRRRSKGVFRDAQELLTPSNLNDSATENVPSSEEPPLPSSLTISGIHTVLRESADCSTCTFVVPAKTHLIDGTVLNIKPGSIICLDKAIKYEMLEFENLQGTLENPITIAYCGN